MLIHHRKDPLSVKMMQTARVFTFTSDRLLVQCASLALGLNQRFYSIGLMGTIVALCGDQGDSTLLLWNCETNEISRLQIVEESVAELDGNTEPESRPHQILLAKRAGTILVAGGAPDSLSTAGMANLHT